MAYSRSKCGPGIGVVAAVLAAVLTGFVLTRSPRGNAEEPSNASKPRTAAATSVPVVHATVKSAKDEKWTVQRDIVPAGKTPEPADNSYCDVCHANYQEEELTEVHRDVGVGCETCHGMSMTHSEDEDNVTPPEIMWASARINDRCMTCHLRKDILPGSKAINHQSFFERLDRPATAGAGEKYCTECHAVEHKLPHRTRVWDRETGKLIKQTGGPAMDR
ncbi:MAG: cytochrome c3 family protein [Pirellulales bacterium]|nr:cytochrome c3 family protein [Pirellulales bacterium]